MRKGKSIFKTILILILLFCVGYTLYESGIVSKYILKTSVNSIEYQKMKSQLNEYKKTEADQKAEEERLRNILMMNTINSEIRKNTKLQLCEGDKTQQVPIKKDAFIKWFDNTLHAEIPYTYRIILNTSNIKASKVENNTVTYEVSIRDKFEIVSELHADKLKFTKDNKYCTVKFYEDDIQNLLKQSQEVIIKQVADDKEIFNAAIEGLEEYLNSQAEVLGYKAEIIYEDW
jgi:hypothetical protein